MKRIKVLLVEDHALTRMGLKTALRRTDDIDVVGEAANGEEAVERAITLKPNVILMDVGMPIMDGIQAAKRIVESNPDIRVIMLTQHDNDRDILASLAAGASGYCLKDVEPDRLYTAIRSVNSGDAWLDASIAGRVLRHYSSKTESTYSASQDVPSQPPAKQPSPSLDRPMVEQLSARELEVLQLIVDGLSNQQIADKLIISLATAKTHVRNILNKLAVDDRTQAAVHAMRRGLV
ncbi:MAG: response regulator transcription factor [Cyanobacteria bacterium]|nr:response regulator transcription factor [Cyanobacteriota bacterium]